MYAVLEIASCLHCLCTPYLALTAEEKQQALEDQWPSQIEGSDFPYVEVLASLSQVVATGSTLFAHLVGLVFAGLEDSM
jgi:hypothetical protein